MTKSVRKKVRKWRQKLGPYSTPAYRARQLRDKSARRTDQK